MRNPHPMLYSKEVLWTRRGACHQSRSPRTPCFCLTLVNRKFPEHGAYTGHSNMSDQTNSFGHYVPQFILRYFTEEGEVHVYDRENNLYERKSPNKIAGEK